MGLNAYEIKDDCRRNLIKYTIKAFSLIPTIDHPVILDIGCGTGESALALVEISNGKIHAVDSDNACISLLKEKVNLLNYTDRIEVIQGSVFDQNLLQYKYDIVLAEGLLNVIGFVKGLSVLVKYLKQSGYLIIHDEFQNDAEKKTLFRKYNLELINTFELDENIWWNEYFCCLERSIKNIDNDFLFKKEINELIEFKNNPRNCRSIYYILHRVLKV